MATLAQELKQVRSDYNKVKQILNEAVCLQCIFSLYVQAVLLTI